MNKNYEKGRRYEYKEKKIWEEDGYLVIRSAGSKSPIDLVAVPCSLVEEQPFILIQLKSGNSKPNIKSDIGLSWLCRTRVPENCRKIVVWYYQKEGKGKAKRIVVYDSFE